MIALQEVERNWQRTGNDDQPELLSRLLPHHYAVYGPAFDMDASTVGADGKVINRRRQFGTMLLSRFPILWSRLHLLPMRKVVRPLNTQNAALEGLIRTPAGPVRIFSIHLSHIGVEERLEQIAFLKALHRRVPLEGGPWSGVDDEPERDWAHGEAEPEAPLAAIWMGDFNSRAGQRRISRHHRPQSRTIRRLPISTVSSMPRSSAGARSRPAIRMSGLHRGQGPEAPARLLLRRLHARRSRVRSVSVDTDCIASDHFPVTVDIDLETPAPNG